MQSTYKTQAIVLAERDYRETDKVITLYTKYYGKVDVLAKGGKKILSKLNPHVPVGSESEVLLARGRGFDRLAGAVLLENFSNIKSSLSATYCVMYLLEVFNALIRGQESDEEIFDRLYECLETVDANAGKKQEVLLYTVNSFLLQVLVLLGEGVEYETFFGRVSKDEFIFHEKLLELSLNYSVIEIPKVKAEEKTLQNFNRLVYEYLRHVTEREIKSYLILERA